MCSTIMFGAGAAARRVQVAVDGCRRTTRVRMLHPVSCHRSTDVQHSALQRCGPARHDRNRNAEAPRRHHRAFCFTFPLDQPALRSHAAPGLFARPGCCALTHTLPLGVRPQSPSRQFTVHTGLAVVRVGYNQL